MLKKWRCDLHIHTCLSPCGDKDMAPTKIIEEAQNLGLNIIGITDHNSVENVFAVMRCGEKFGIKVIGGIEITSEEEVHILALFDNDTSLMKIQEIVYENLSDEENDEAFFGEQLIVDEDDKIIGKNRRLLIGATKLKVDNIVDIIHNLGGIAIASHIDRQGFSIIGQLGFIPENLKLDAVEVSGKNQISNIKNQKFPIVSFSDAHRLDDMGKSSTTFFMEEPTIDEIKKALLGKDRRKVLVNW